MIEMGFPALAKDRRRAHEERRESERLDTVTEKGERMPLDVRITPPRERIRQEDPYAVLPLRGEDGHVNWIIADAEGTPHQIAKTLPELLEIVLRNAGKKADLDKCIGLVLSTTPVGQFPASD